MFEFIYDRSYARNKKTLAVFGIAYTKAQHKAYKQKLIAKDLKTISVKGAVYDKGLAWPVHEYNCKRYTKWADKNGYYSMFEPEEASDCKRRSMEKARDYTAKHKPALQQYVDCLAEVVESTPRFHLMNEREYRLITLNQTTLYGFKENAYVCDQSWSLGMAGSDKVATLVAA